jgi:hypothetical protein
LAGQSPLLFFGDSGSTLLAFVNEIGKGSEASVPRDTYYGVEMSE